MIYQLILTLNHFKYLVLEKNPNMSDTELELINSKALLPMSFCNRCSRLLRCPITLLKNVGDICDKCVLSEDANTPRVHNLALETVLKNLVLPCRNISKGCSERLGYLDMLTHDSVCTYGDRTCPARMFENCKWKGSLTDIVTHLTTEHQNLAVRGYNNFFQFNIDVLSGQIIKILYTDDDCCVLRIRCDVRENKKLYYIMYYMENKDGTASNILYTIIQKHNNSTNDISYKPLSYRKDYKEHFDEKRALTINLPSNICRSTTITVLQKNTEVDNELLKFLECIVCDYLMKPPIYLCSVGHNICNTCIKKLQKCPLCEATYTGTRNFTLEALCENTKFPCSNRKHGCRVSLLITDIEKHESECTSKPFSCPFFNVCFWEASVSSHESHLKVCHGDKLVFNSYNRTRIKVSPDYFDMYCMVAYGRIFRVCHKQNKETNKAYWNVQVYGRSIEKEKYKYEVGLVHYHNEHKIYTKSDICRYLCNKKMFAKSISFCNEDISLFSSNNEFTCYCKISKVGN